MNYLRVSIMNLTKTHGVSELIASLMTLLITISLGSIILYIINEYSSNYQTLLKSMLEGEYSNRVKSVDAIMAIGNETSNEVLLIIANGKVELRITALYINDILVENTSLTLKPLDITIVKVKSPIKLRSGDIFIAKVIHEGGEEVIYGYTYK